MSLREVVVSGWIGGAASGDETAALESGNILFCRDLRFDIDSPEVRLFTPDILGSAKNASFDPARGRLGGSSLDGEQADALAGMMRRFSDAAAELVDAV